MLRCINCGLNVTRIRRHSTEYLPVNVRAEIQERNALPDIPSNSVVCHECWLLLNGVPGTTGLSRVGHENVCVHCGRSLYRLRAHMLTNNTDRESRIRSVVEERIMPRHLRSSDRICHPCWQRCHSLAANYAAPSTSSSASSHAPNVVNPNSQELPDHEMESSHPDDEVVSVTTTVESTQSVPTIILSQFGRASDTQAHCFFPGCTRTERLVVPQSIRISLFADFRYYVPPNCRICHYHLRTNLWHQLNEIENVNHSFTEDYIYDFTSLLQQERSVDFENIHMMDDHLVHYWFGLSKEKFQSLLAEVPRLSSMYRGSTALAALLLKLRNGDSNERIASLFKMPRSTLENLMSKAREIMHQDFVPNHLGLSHISREEIANRNLLIPTSLFGGTNTNGEAIPIVIADGTYIYCQKSSNYKYQKDTYSLHKYRNLVKPFLFVCCDGYIIEILGPYPATTSDAEIMKNEFHESQPLRQYFNENDVFILDWGFRDAVSLLESCNYRVHMPLSLREGETQLSTLAANKTRAVTICRWVVEAVNGIFKEQFKLFRQEFFNRASAHLMIDFSIAAALINKFYTRYTDRTDASQIVEVISQKMFLNNTLADFVNNNNYNRRRAHFISINVDSNNVTDFPRLSYEDLILIACGTYQLKQARSYYGEHIRFDGSYTVEVCREAHLSDLREELSLSENTWLLRGKIQSRHISRKIYYVYILINPNENGREAILQYCCNCMVGRRTVGCCAHIMTIIWYLGWARYQSNIEPPAPFLDNLLIKYDNVNDE